MKLAFSTLGCPDWNFWDVFSTAKDLGYSAVEIRGIRREIYAPNIKELSVDIDETLGRLKNMGVGISMLTSAATFAIHGEEEQSMKEAKEYIDLAKKLGVPFVRIMSTDKPQFDGGDIALCKRQFSELVDYANGTGVMPLMETNGLFVDTKSLANFLDNVGGECGALWDVHHPYRFGDETVEQTIENLGDRIKYVHLKDSIIEKGAPSYRMMGNGNIPLSSAIQSLNSNGYKGYFSLEWVKRWNKDLEEPGIVFSHYVNYMKKFNK